MIPEHAVEWEFDNKGLVTVKALKSENKLFQKFIQFLGYSLYKQVRLDPVGSFVWLQMDGKTNFLLIGDKMKIEFGDSIEPVYERLGKYAHVLVLQRYIHLTH